MVAIDSTFDGEHQNLPVRLKSFDNHATDFVASRALIACAKSLFDSIFTLGAMPRDGFLHLRMPHVSGGDKWVLAALPPFLVKKGKNCETSTNVVVTRNADEPDTSYAIDSIFNASSLRSLIGITNATTGALAGWRTRLSTTRAATGSSKHVFCWP